MRFARMLIAAAMVGLPTSRATAGPPAAEALFQEGRQLLEAGQIDEACLRLAESYWQEPASGTLLNLARCHQAQGKIATAWAEYAAAARLSRAQGREDRARAAEEQAAALKPRLSRLNLRMSEPPAGLKVLIDSGSLSYRRTSFRATGSPCRSASRWSSLFKKSMTALRVSQRICLTIW